MGMAANVPYDQRHRPTASQPIKSYSTGEDLYKYDSRMPLDTLTDEELKDLKIDLDNELGAVKEQLRAAKVNAAVSGVYAPKDWFLRANSAKHHFGVLSQRIQQELSKRKITLKRKRAVTSLPELFMNIAEEHLDQKTFVELLVLARQEYKEQNPT